MSIEDTLRAIVREELRAALAELRELVRAKPAAAGDDALLTVEQVSQRVGGVQPETVRRWIEAGHLRARRAGHRWVVRPIDLEQFLAQAGGAHETLGPEQHVELVKRRIAKAGGRR